MQDSKILYALRNGDDCVGIVWETELGKVITLQGTINPQYDLTIYDTTGKAIDNVDLRNVLMSILPIK